MNQQQMWIADGNRIEIARDEHGNRASAFGSTRGEAETIVREHNATVEELHAIKALLDDAIEHQRAQLPDCCHAHALAVLCDVRGDATR